MRLRPSSVAAITLAIGVVGLVIAPVVYLIVQALSKPDVLQHVLVDPGSRQLLWRSLALAGAVAATSMALGTMLAWLTIRPAWPRWWRTTLLVLLCTALAVPSYVAAFGLIAATGSSGLLGGIMPAGFHVRDYPFLASWVVLVCCTYPYVLLSVRSAMLRECASLEEAAMCLGASRMRVFLTIALPRLAPSVIWGGMLAALYSLADFGAVSLLGYETLTWGIYSRYHTAFAIDEARALAFILAVVTVILIVMMRVVRPDLTPATSDVPMKPVPVRMRGWSVPAHVLMLIPIGVGVALPVAAAVHWLSQSDIIADNLRATANPAMATIFIALLAAMIVPLLALPVASLHLPHSDANRKARLRSIITPLTLAGFALPGIVIAIAGISLALRMDQFIEWLFNLPMQNRLYQSHLLLLLAYAALFLPEAVGPLRAGAARIHPDQLDAGRQFDGNNFSNWWRIALPQLAPGLAAGGALVFVTTAKELPATLLMAPPEFQTLATRLWGAMSEAYFAQAAASALVLLVIAAVGLALLLLLERIGHTE